MSRLIRKKMKKPTVYFILINLFFASFYLDSWQNANTTSRVLPVLSIVDLGTMKVDSFANKTIDKSFVNGHYYLDKAPLPSYIIVPFYAALKATGLIKQSTDFETYSKPIFLLGSFICGSIPFVIICLVFFVYASKYTDNNWSAALSMLFLYTSFVFIYSGTFFAHVFSSCLLLLSYIFLKDKQRYFYSGLFLGLSVFSDYSVGFIALFWIVQIYFNERKVKSMVFFFAGLSPIIFSMIVYNLWTTGAPFDLLYNHSAEEGFANAGNLGFSYPSIFALYGLTISPYRGLLIYCPLLFFSLFTLLKEKQLLRIHWTKNYLFLITVGYFLMISAHKMWWGGWSYGPRQLMPIGVLLLFESVVFISKIEIKKFVFYLFSSLCLIITWVVKSTVMYSVPTEIKNPFTDYFFQKVVSGASNPNNLFTMIFGLNPWTAAIFWLLSFAVLMFFLHFRSERKFL